MGEDESLLKKVEDQFVNHVDKFKEVPVAFIASDETLDKIINETKKDCIWFIKSNEQMKEEGARYRGIIFEIDDTLDFGIINTRNKN
jgi:hypothetical protein